MTDPWLDELVDNLKQRDAAAQRRQLIVTAPTTTTHATRHTPHTSHTPPSERTTNATSTPYIRVQIDGQLRELINLAGNDYLAIAHHPHLIQAAQQAAGQYGVGSGASRLVSGHLAIHAEAEARFAAFKHPSNHAHHQKHKHDPEPEHRRAHDHPNAALLCPTGYMANLAVISSLAGPDDLICMDKLNHASLLDAARASGALLRIYPHRDTNKLQRLLQRHPDARRRFIVTDSVFSMDGTVADLPTLADLADQYDAILIVDEAHGTGVLGQTGAGLAQLQGVADRIDVTISTASKALGGLGGIITGPTPVIDTVVNHGRSFIYTTGAMPMQAAALIAALDVIRDEPWRRQRVCELAQTVRQALPTTTQPPHNTTCDVATPIIPLITGSSQSAMTLADQLLDHGFYAPAIRPPTVPIGTARVRLSLRADLTDAMIDRLRDVIATCAPR